MMGCEHIRNLQGISGCEVVAVADTFEGSLQKAQDLLPKVAIYNDYDLMIKNETLDVVIIATPNHTHFEILRELVKAEVHIFVEKPLCINVDECQQIIRIAKNSAVANRLIWVGLEYRFMAPTARLLNEVSEGTCGIVQMVSIREHRFPFLVKVDNWNRFSRNTGGTLVEKCCHFFDLMVLLARSAPVSVYASGAQSVNHLDEVYNGQKSDILDNAFVIVDFENGVRGLLDLSMFAEGSRNEQEICVVGDSAKIEALITESKLRIGRRNLGAAGVSEIEVKQSETVIKGFHAGASYIEHVKMQEAIRKNLPSLVTLEDGLLSVAIGQAAHLSIAEKRRVEMSELLGDD